MKTHSRRAFLRQGTAAWAISPFMAVPLTPSSTEDDCTRQEINVLQKMGNSAYKGLWGNLKGITEKEADWKPNPESNSTRWVVGHLCWFEEWVGDALENKGRYLTDKNPDSVKEPSVEALKTRFDAAHARLASLVSSLTADQLRKEISYLGRMQITIEDLLQTHVMHLSGHRFQIRYIRGTYSRVFHTNKADFDPW